MENTESEFPVQSTTKFNFLQTTIIKLFPEKLEVSALPAGCGTSQKWVLFLQGVVPVRSECSSCRVSYQSEVCALPAGCRISEGSPSRPVIYVVKDIMQY